MTSDVIPNDCWTEHDGQSRILDPVKVTARFTTIFDEAIEAAARRIEDRISVLTESQRQWRTNDPASPEIARIETVIEEFGLAASSIRSLKLEGK